jgi:transcription antitermination factor NusG
MEADMPLTYYAVRVRPQKEYLARQLLTQQGHVIYLPEENARRRLSKRDRRLYGWVNVPLLPGYVFAGVRSNLELPKLFVWSFVLSVVGDPSTNEPHPISNADMLHIRTESARLCSIKAAPIDWAPKRGEFYRIVHGPFAVQNLVVKCEAIIGKKARAFFADLGGRLVTIQSKDVEAA